MLDALSNIPPGLNSPYGPYGGIPSGNIANSGFAPASGINTQNPILDLVLNTVLSGVMGDTPMLRTFGRPKVSDYSYTSMQERQRVSGIVTPDVIASNPMFGANISGDLGKNRLFQMAGDAFFSPGGSMGEAFNTVYGRFTRDLAGPGLRNASTNAILAANIVKNIDRTFLDEDGMYDYRKTYGFDRAETYRNLDNYNRVFGGFTGFVDSRDEADKALEVGDLAQTALQEAERRGDITPEQAQVQRQGLAASEEQLQATRNNAPQELTNFVGQSLQNIGTGLGLTPDFPVNISGQGTTQDSVNNTLDGNPEVPAGSESAEVSAQVERPDVPVSAERPDVPVSAERPDVPVSAERPDVPVSAERPDVPAPTEGAVAPEVPNQTERPVAPEVLNQTERSDTLEAPVQAERPETPTASPQIDRPVIPGDSVQADRPNVTEVPFQTEGFEAPTVPVQTERSEARNAPAQVDQSSPNAGFVDTNGNVFEVPSNFPTFQPFYDVPDSTDRPEASNDLDPEGRPIKPGSPSQTEIPGVSPQEERPETLEVPVQTERPDRPAVAAQIDKPAAATVPPQTERPLTPEIASQTERPSVIEVSPQIERSEASRVTVQTDRSDASTQAGVPVVPETSNRADSQESTTVTTQAETPEEPTVSAQTERSDSSTQVEQLEEVSEELKRKRSSFDGLSKEYQEVLKFVAPDSQSPRAGTNKIQSQEIERRLDKIVDEITVLDEKEGQERKAQYNALKQQVANNVEGAVSKYQGQAQNIINTFGTPQQQAQAAAIPQDNSQGPMAVLAQPRTEQNAAQQDAEAQKILEVNKMTREAQNLFGQDIGGAELMESVRGLVDGASEMTTSDVTDLLQRIQATAVVVDMSNEAIVKYFNVIDNMYKGMGIRSGNRSNMAQNALLAADATVRARKLEAQQNGEMYLGPNAGELAQKFAEYQGRFARSDRNSRLNAYLTGLSDEGSEGQVKAQLAQFVEAGDLEGGINLIKEAREDGRISQDSQKMIGMLESRIATEGVSEEQQKYMKDSLVQLYGEDRANKMMANLTGENIEEVFESSGKTFGDRLFGMRNDNASAQFISEQLGSGAVEKLEAAFESGEISGDDLRDSERLRGRLQTMFEGASPEAISAVEKQITGRMFMTGSEVLLDTMQDPEARAEFVENQKRMKETKAEINDVMENRAEYMRDLNPAGETFQLAYDTMRRMKKAGVTDFSDPQAILAASGGALADWAGMSAEERNQMNAAVQAFTGGDQQIQGEGMVDYKEETDKIKQKAEAYAEEQVQLLRDKGVTDEEYLGEIKERHKKSKEEELTTELRESLRVGGDKDGSKDDGGTEKSGTDETALQQVLNAIGTVANAISGLGEKGPVRSDGNPNARVENSLFDRIMHG